MQIRNFNPALTNAQCEIYELLTMNKVWTVWNMDKITEDYINQV